MDDQHLSVELLRSIHRGERNPGDLATVAMAHLFEKCSECRRAFELWRREQDDAASNPLLSRYDQAFDRVRARLRGEPSCLGVNSSPLERSVEAEELRAQKLLEEVLSRPPSARADLIREQPGRFANPVLADLLLVQAWECLPARPKDSYTWAQLARIALQSTNATAYETELYARALAFQSNALRAQGELRAAANLIEVGRFLLKAQGGGDILTRAEFDSFEGSLRRCQSRFEDARDLYSRAVMSFAMAGRNVEASKILLILGEVLRELGEVDRAIDAAAHALDTARQEGLLGLERLARHNLTFFLHSAGNHEEARRMFDESEDLYQQVDLPLKLRRIWLSAHLSKAEGKLAEAEEAYREVQRGFLYIGRGYSAASAALHLAMLYAEQGRTADLKRVAEEIIPIFEAQDVHREAAAALMLFQDAVRAEQVTLRYLIELSRYLERARLDPSLAFQRPA